MRAALLVPGLAYAALVYQVSSTHSFLADSRRHDPTLDEIGKEMRDAGHKIERAFRGAQTGPAYHGRAKMPLMDSIEVMRADLCWYRANLIEHEKCMEWLVEHCEKKSTGQGICIKLPGYVEKKCREGHPDAAHWAKELGMKNCRRAGLWEAAEKEEDEEGDEGESERAVEEEVRRSSRVTHARADDKDGDGVEDSRDVFPNNPLEWRDSDRDGTGDNADKWPLDPSCAHEGERCAGASPAAAPAGAPGAPAAPDGLSMKANIGLPSQGYNEHSVKYVQHKDGSTATRDWRREWPASGGDDPTSVHDVCKENPNHAWCKLKLSNSARRAYARSHP